MTGRIRALLVTSIALAASPAVTASPAAGETTVSEPKGSAEEGYDVTITVPIDCVGCKGKKAPDGKTDLAQYWKQTAEKAWNEAFKKWPLCTGFKGRLVVDIAALDANAPVSVGRHRVEVKGPAGWDGIPEPTPGGPEGATEQQRAPDGTRFYTEDANGRMPANATPTVISHEIGHVLGLGDDRDVNGVALSNREGKLMTGGAKLANGKKVTWNTPLAIDKNLVDRIGKQIANAGKACIKKWSGAFNGTGENIGVVECQDVTTISGDFTMAIADSGDATLTGQIVTTSSCRGVTATAESDFTLEGKKTRSQISFAPVAIFPWPLDLRVRANHASGTSTYDPSAQYHTTINVTADCQNCDENVG